MIDSLPCGLIAPKLNREELRTAAYKMACAAMPKKGISKACIGEYGGGAFYGNCFRDKDLVLLVGGVIHKIEHGKYGGLGHSSSESKKARSVLEGFRAEGSNFFQSLYGDFSLVIYDLELRKVVLARDMLGVAPLFFAAPSGCIVFAPSMAGIFASGMLERTVSNKKVFSFLQGSELPGDWSCFDGVSRVPASHSVTLDLIGGQKFTRYLQLGHKLATSSTSFEENAERLRMIFIEAVQKRIPDKGVIAAEVSGGLDSSSVFSAARSLEGSRVLPISGTFSRFPSCDESEFIDAVSSKWSAKSCKLDVDSQSLVSAASRSFAQFQGLHNAANIHITTSISDYARDLQCAAVLNGVDGDNVTSHGRNFLSELGLSGDWDEFVELAVSVGPSYARYAKAPAAALCYAFGVPVLRRLLYRGRMINFARGFGALSSVPGVSRRHMLDLLFKGMQRGVLERRFSVRSSSAGGYWQGRFPRNAFNPIFLDSMNVTANLAAMFPLARQECLTERDSHILGFENGVNQHYFEYSWANSAADGIFKISPFMDRGLLEFCLSIPPEQKLRNGFSRAIFREAMKPFLPDTLLKRKWKTDLSPSSLNKVSVEVLPVLKARLKSDGDLLFAYLDSQFVFDVLRHAEERSADRATLTQVWIIYCLSEWLYRMPQLYTTRN